MIGASSYSTVCISVASICRSMMNTYWLISKRQFLRAWLIFFVNESQDSIMQFIYLVTYVSIKNNDAIVQELR